MKFSFWMLVDPILYFLYELSKPKTKEEPLKPLEVPDETVGRTIPVLFGTRKINSPIMLWWGDLFIIKAPVDPQGKK